MIRLLLALQQPRSSMPGLLDEWTQPDRGQWMRGGDRYGDGMRFRDLRTAPRLQDIITSPRASNDLGRMVQIVNGREMTPIQLSNELATRDIVPRSMRGIPLGDLALPEREEARFMILRD